MMTWVFSLKCTSDPKTNSPGALGFLNGVAGWEVPEVEGGLDLTGDSSEIFVGEEVWPTRAVWAIPDE